MFTRIRTAHRVSGFIVGVVITLVLSGTAVAVTDTSFTYSSAMTGYLSIHPMDLAPANGTSASTYSVSYGGGALSASGVGCYNTGVNLPQMARVINVQTYYDFVSGSGSYLYLVRNGLSTDPTEFLVRRQITDTDGMRKSVTDTVPSTLRTVRNNLYSYGFGICLGAGDQFEGTRITYTYTSAGD